MSISDKTKEKATEVPSQFILLLQMLNHSFVFFLNEVLKRFVKVKSVDYSLLMNYAKKMKAEVAIRHYLEVLL